MNEKALEKQKERASERDKASKIKLTQKRSERDLKPVEGVQRLNNLALVYHDHLGQPKEPRHAKNEKCNPTSGHFKTESIMTTNHQPETKNSSTVH